MHNLKRSARLARNDAMLADVRNGLSQGQKELPPKFFYDARGSRLFEQITTLDEYYPTRTERTLLESLMPAWIREMGPVSLLELGAGSAGKSRIILNAMRDGGTLGTYVPIDVSADFLAETARRLRAEYPGLRVIPSVADISNGLHLPAVPRPALFAFLGSTIGNFEDAAAIALLRRIAAGMQPGDRFLLGADLVKDRDLIEAAYNDERGITAEFNRNVLRVLNRELGADFNEAGFRHQAFFNPVQSRIEMHLVATRRQVVEIPGVGGIPFREGESIRTEISRKFSRPMLEEMFCAAGLVIERWETDPRKWYAVMTGILAPGRRRVRVSGHGRLVAALRKDLRANTFSLATASAATVGRVGAEIEFIALRANDARPCPVESSSGIHSLGFLRAYGSSRGWVEELSAKGTRRFRIPGRGTISFEPGGQLEFSTATASTASGVLSHLAAVVPPLRRAARDAGIALLEVGIDPVNPIDAAPMQLFADRYVRMARYFESIGPAGGRMMRQTAAFHLNLDFGDENMLRWRVLNAAAPYLTAIFANSSRYAGASAGFKSTRANVWRSLDRARTGILPAGPVAEDEYLDFALGAPAMLLDPVAGRYLPFGEYWALGNASLGDWHEHLTTLFPDIRPRGYLEIRCLDAIPAEWYPAPIALATGLLYDRPSLRTANEALGSPDPGLLSRAATNGMTDENLAVVARDIFAIGLAGARALGPSFIAEGDVEVAEEFFRQFTARGRTLADDGCSPTPADFTVPLL